MTLFKTLFVAGSVALLISSCGGDSEKHDAEHAEQISTEDTMQHTATDTTKFKFDFAIANIPSPANRMHDVIAYGIPYDNSIMSDPKKVGAYTTEYKKALNMGIYNMDLAYSIMNDKGQDVLNYLKNILSLSDAIGMQNSINAMVGKRFESNINNKDSLFTVWDEILIKSDTYLRSNERVYTASLVFTGSWLESLYLSSKISEKVTDAAIREKARTNLWEQRLHLGNLISLLNDYKDNKDCASLLADLKPIYDEVVANRQPSELNDEDFVSISNKIYALRDKVTQ